MALLDSGSGTANVADVDANSNLRVNLPGYSAAGVVQNGGPKAAPAMFSENDPGTKTGSRYVSSPETDDDYRLRVSVDHILDRETFNYTAQNTGKHSHTFTTITATVSANGLLTNSGAGVATATGMTFGTFAEFPVGMGATSIYSETNMSLNVATASIPSNAVIDVGMFRRGATTAFAPTDGVYFRFTSAGVQGVVNNNAVETSSTPFAPGFLANENHLYQIAITEKSCEFWIDNVLYTEIVTPIANAQPFRSTTLPWSIRHANTGAVGATLQATITDYTISHGGSLYASTLAQIGNRSLGSYQGLSGVRWRAHAELDRQRRGRRRDRHGDPLPPVEVRRDHRRDRRRRRHVGFGPEHQHHLDRRERHRLGDLVRADRGQRLSRRCPPPARAPASSPGARLWEGSAA